MSAVTFIPIKFLHFSDFAPNLFPGQGLEHAGMVEGAPAIWEWDGMILFSLLSGKTPGKRENPSEQQALGGSVCEAELSRSRASLGLSLRKDTGGGIHGWREQVLAGL